MSVIQSIRERYAKWAVIAIALALLGFILTDYFQAKNKMGAGNSSTLGLVNGKKIDYISFETKLKARDDQQQAAAQQQQQEYTEEQKHQTAEQMWNQEVEEIIMTSEFKKVGIDVGKKEFNDYLFGQNPPQDLRQRFSDQQGNYDGAAAQNAINQLRRSPNQAERDQLDAYLASMEYNRKMEKYNSLLSNSVYYPKWYVEKQNTEAAGLAKISFVRYPYSKISDSAIKITDKEIEDYVSKNKDQYKQTESRSIAYTIFNASPTEADSAQLRKQLADLKPEFTADTTTTRFLSRYGSTIAYSDMCVGKTFMKMPSKDSIIALAKGAVYGPYLDGHTYALAKMIEIKTLPDSVRCRHILISNDPSQGGVVDSIAKKKMDSVEVAIKGGASWADLVQKYNPQSDGSRAKNGEMTFSSFDMQQPNFAKEFAQFALFEGKKGEKKVVKTSFGYHLIEILELKNPEAHYKFAQFAKSIIASDETERVVLEDASKFVSESQDLKAFNDNIAKSNGRIQKFEARNIGPNDISIQDIDQRLAGGFGQTVSCRTLVREIYKADKGDVIKQERIGDARSGYKYVVAVVTDILKEGTQPAYVARAGSANAQGVERILKDKKKAEQIKQMIGKVSTLEAVAATLKDSIITVDSVRIADGRGRITETKVLGAAFNIANKGKVINEPIAGRDAVYVVRVDDLTTTSVAVADVQMQKEQMRQRAKQMQSFYSSPVKLMKDQATIKDNRRNFY